MFDKFFDMLNVRGLHEGKNKRKDFRRPYTCAEDDRLVVSLFPFASHGLW